MSTAMIAFYWASVGMYFWFLYKSRKESRRQHQMILDVFENNKEITIHALKLTLKWYVDNEDYEGAQRCVESLERIKKEVKK